MITAVSRPAAWVMSYSAAGLPPVSAPGAARARSWRRAAMTLKPWAL
jgi:hypothetical protein